MPRARGCGTCALAGTITCASSSCGRTSARRTRTCRAATRCPSASSARRTTSASCRPSQRRTTAARTTSTGRERARGPARAGCVRGGSNPSDGSRRLPPHHHARSTLARSQLSRELSPAAAAAATRSAGAGSPAAAAGHVAVAEQRLRWGRVERRRPRQRHLRGRVARLHARRRRHVRRRARRHVSGESQRSHPSASSSLASPRLSLPHLRLTLRFAWTLTQVLAGRSGGVRGQGEATHAHTHALRADRSQGVPFTALDAIARLGLQLRRRRRPRRLPSTTAIAAAAIATAAAAATAVAAAAVAATVAASLATTLSATSHAGRRVLASDHDRTYHRR